MTQRIRIYVLAVLVPLLFGTGPCYCGPDDECELCGEQSCEDDNVSECRCANSDGQKTLVTLDDCTEREESCTLIRAGSVEGGIDTGFALCMEACEVPGQVVCRGEEAPHWWVCHDPAACGVEEPDGDPEARCRATLAQMVLAHIEATAEGVAPQPGAPRAGQRWLDSGMTCDACESSCGCGVGFDCRAGHCLRGDVDRELVCCGRERSAPCPDGAACERRDGSQGTCETVGRCGECASTADCERELCTWPGGDLPGVCLTVAEANDVARACREDVNAVWSRDVCGRWLAEVESCSAGFYCKGESCVAGAPEIEVSPSLLVFPETRVGESATLQLHIGNVGELELDVSAIAVEAGFADVFTLAPESARVAADDIVTIAVTFTPTAAGEVQARLTIRSDDDDEEVTTILMNAPAVP